MRKISTRQRVLSLLIKGMVKYKMGEHEFTILGADGETHRIVMFGGFIPQSVFADIHVVGSTEGKRRLRELRADPELQNWYVFDKRKNGRNYGYRIRARTPMVELASHTHVMVHPLSNK